MNNLLDCPQCGFETLVFFEGVCRECNIENQQRLDTHNFEYDAWQKMSDQQRAEAIRRGYE